MKKYQIIGGQYEYKWYGESDSIRGAKCIATRHVEYWDNWQGWHKPLIYKSDDIVEIVSKGRFTSFDGEIIRIPKELAEPIV